MSDPQKSLARLAMRLRAATEFPPQRCKQFLAELPEASRLAYVEYIECNHHSLFIDPVELDPAIRAALAGLRLEAGHLKEQGAFGWGMGSGGALLAWVKQELLARHGIAWRTPREMNPDCAVD